MKKNILLVLVLSFVLLISASAISAADKTVIEYWHGQPDTMGGAQIEKFVQEFNEQNDHIEVVTKYFPDQYTGILQGLQAEAAAGMAPGLIQLGWLFADYFKNNFEYITPQDLIDKYYPEDANYLTDAFAENILDLCNFGGERIGVPYSLSNSVLFYNVDLLKEAGLSGEAPKTWEEAKEFSRAIKEKTGKYGLFIEDYNWTFYTLMSSNGAQVTKFEDGLSYANFAEGDEGAEAFNFFKEMYDEGIALHTTVAEGNQSFKDGNVGMDFATIAQMASIEASAQFDVASAPEPTFGDKTPVLHAGGCMLAITARTEEEQKATWEFMKFLLSPENISQWTKATGYIPARKDVADDPAYLKGYLEENDLMKASMDQVPFMAAWPYYSGDAGLPADEHMKDVRDRIFNGADAKETLTEAQEYINEMVN